MENQKNQTQEFLFNGLTINGFLMLLLNLVLIATLPIIMIIPIISIMWIGIIAAILGFLMLFGYVMLEPNECRAMVFFVSYKGTLYKTGLSWVNPFLTAKKVSLRAKNLNVDPIKVNDKNGNPILIGLVLVWKVKDIYKALFDIDTEIITGDTAVSRMKQFENFVRVQSDAALRQVAGQYAYDSLGSDNKGLTLSDGGEEINSQMEEKLNERLNMAGICVIEARINYLAYAPEIAAVMLRRQQAEAIIAAREKIVEGAVSMVKLALDKLGNEEIVDLDNDKKAAMVSNLLVVLCADESAQPVLNTGSLYQ